MPKLPDGVPLKAEKLLIRAVPAMKAWIVGRARARNQSLSDVVRDLVQSEMDFEARQDAAGARARR